ncbi:MAG: glycosyltransferase family 9 protein, partial [Gemmatimonadales bacterium]
AELTVVVGRRAAELARWHPAVDRVLVFDWGPLRLFPFLRELRRRPFDAWLDPKDHFSRNQSFVARAARARVKVGFNRPDGGPFDRQLPPPAEPPRHMSEMLLAPLEVLGVRPRLPPTLSLGLPPESVARADALLGSDQARQVLMNISAGRADRYWEESKWVEWAVAVSRFGPARFWLTSSPEDGALAERIVEGVRQRGGALCRLPPGSLLDVAAVVARMDAVVTMDTSIVHLASVFARPIVALFSNYEANFRWFGPLSPARAVVRGDRIADIPVAEVVAAYQRLLEGR